MVERRAEKKKNTNKKKKQLRLKHNSGHARFIFIPWSGMSLYQSKIWKEQKEPREKGATKLFCSACFAAVQQQVTRAN